VPGGIGKDFAAISEGRHYALGNRRVEALTEKEFPAAVGQKESRYAFDRGGAHFAVLDACFRSDGRRLLFGDPHLRRPPQVREALTRR
jgi:hypothetical protein